MPAPPAAPGKPKDPSQMSLRRHKRQWNAAYKDFSQKLKAFKNGINGKGDTKFQLPPSDIKFPLPPEVGAMLDNLATEFQSMVADAHSIVQDQETYSRVRRKRKPKPAQVPEAPAQPSAPSPEAAPPAVVETLSRLGEDHEAMLEVFASSKLSRFWQYMQAPFSRKPFNKQRISLLSLSADLYYQLQDLENEVLSLKIKSVPKSIAKYQAVRSTFDSIKTTTVRLIEMMAKKEEQPTPAQEPSAGEAPPPSSPPPPPPSAPKLGGDADIKEIEKELHIISDTGLAAQAIMEIHSLIQEYHKETDVQAKSMFKDQLKKAYRIMLKSIVNDVQKKYGPADIKSSQDIINLIIKNRAKQATISNMLTKESHNAFTRFLKKQLVKARSYNESAGQRLEIVDIIDETKNLLKQFMDYLEGGIDSDNLENHLKALGDNMASLNGPLSVLVSLYEQEFYKQESKKKEKGKDKKEESSDLDPFMDYMMRRRVKRDLQRGLS